MRSVSRRTLKFQELLPPLLRGGGDAAADRATVLRLAAGFLGIAGFVAVGLWVEFGGLSKAAYLLAALLCFGLYGAVTLRPEPCVRKRGASTGRRS